MSRQRRHDWDAPDDIDDGDLDENSSSSDDISNAVRYVPTSAGSPLKVLSRAEKRDALGIKNSVLNNPPAIKRQPALKKPNPRKRDQLVKFYATKGLRKTTKLQRNVGFKSSGATQKKRNLQAKFEELDIARRNAVMNSSRETLPREEEEQRKKLRSPIGLESDQESSPPGKPDHPRISENEHGATNCPTDDNASDLISLKGQKTKTLTDPEKPSEHPSPDRADLKAEITNQTEPKVERAEIPLIDLDSGDNSTDSHLTPPLIFLDSHEEAEKNNKELSISPENPRTEPTEKIAEPVTMAETEKQQLDPASTKIKAKLSGTAKRKASSPLKSPPSKKLPDIYARHNTRPMRARQPPTMLSERAFTSVVDISDENLDEPTSHRIHTPSYHPTIEATSIEMKSHQIDVVDLKTLTPPSTSHPTTVYLFEESFEHSSGIKSPITSKQSTPHKKVQFSPEVRTTQIHPSSLPSKATESTSTPIVLDPDWLNTPSIISPIELLERPMTLDELRRWKINRAANRDAV